MQLCLIKAQVKSGAAVRCDRWRTDRSVTPGTFFQDDIVSINVGSKNNSI